MHSNWRVACVRIPRFPIGAVWQHAIAGGKRSTPRTGASPVPVPRLPNQSQTPNQNGLAPRPLSPGNGVSPKRTPGRMDSSFAKEEGTLKKENERKQASIERVTDTPGPHWDDLPIALSDGLRIRAVTAAGARAQIRSGMTVTEAQSRCADLEVLPWDQVVIDEEVRRATAAFLGASPQVTPVTGAPGMWWRPFWSPATWKASA